MELSDLWSPIFILLCAFVIGWAAEAAQTFMSRAVALSVLAWLQTLPEFAVEASIAWHQERDLMIANLTGSLRLLVGLGWPMIFFVHFFFQGVMKRKKVREIKLDDEDFHSVIFLFISISYFLIILAKRQLTWIDSIVLSAIYGAYLYLSSRLPAHSGEEEEDLPWVARKVVALPRFPKIGVVVTLFALGGLGLYVCVHPFIQVLQKWAIAAGISTFVFVQWVAPFLSEFPEKVSAFNWARQPRKAPMAVMNMVSSNINQWTMLAAMLPIVFNLSLGRLEPIVFDGFKMHELALTIAQSFLGGLLLLDMRFSIWDAGVLFILWLVQFIYAPSRELILWIYVGWSLIEIVGYLTRRHMPRALVLAGKFGERLK